MMIAHLPELAAWLVLIPPILGAFMALGHALL